MYFRVILRISYKMLLKWEQLVFVFSLVVFVFLLDDSAKTTFSVGLGVVESSYLQLGGSNCFSGFCRRLRRMFRRRRGSENNQVNMSGTPSDGTAGERGDEEGQAAANGNTGTQNQGYLEEDGRGIEPIYDNIDQEMFGNPGSGFGNIVDTPAPTLPPKRRNRHAKTRTPASRSGVGGGGGDDIPIPAPRSRNRVGGGGGDDSGGSNDILYAKLSFSGNSGSGIHRSGSEDDRTRYATIRGIHTDATGNQNVDDIIYASLGWDNGVGGSRPPAPAPGEPTVYQSIRDVRGGSTDNPYEHDDANAKFV